MKYLLSILLLSSVALADSSPNENKDEKQCQNVIVRVCKGETVKVVKKAKKKAKAAVVVKEQEPPKTHVITQVREVTKKNTVILYTHKSFTGLNVATSNGTGSQSATVSSNYSQTVGVEYIRHELLDTPIAGMVGVDAQGLIMVGAGLDW